MPIEINPGLCVAYQLTAALQTALSDGEGIMKMLPVGRPRKHAAMRWALQRVSRRGAALPLLDV